MWRKLSLDKSKEEITRKENKGPRKDANGTQNEIKRIQGRTNRIEMVPKKNICEHICQTVSSVSSPFPLSQGAGLSPAPSRWQTAKGCHTGCGESLPLQNSKKETDTVCKRSLHTSLHLNSSNLSGELCVRACSYWILKELLRLLVHGWVASKMQMTVGSRDCKYTKLTGMHSEAQIRGLAPSKNRFRTFFKCIYICVYIYNWSINWDGIIYPNNNTK